MIWTLLGAGALLWLPGGLTARAAGARTRWALVAAPAVTWGVLGLGAVAVPAVGLRWGPWPVLAWCALVVLTVGLLRGACTRRTSGRAASGPVTSATWTPGTTAGDAPPAQAQVPVRRWPVVAAVGAAAVLLVALGWRSGVSPDTPGQLWDAVWHANLATYVATTGQSDPRLAATALVSAGWRDSPAYYPDALHVLTALLMQVTGTGAVPALAAVVAVAYGVVVPIGVAALVWRLTGRSVAGAATAALVSVLPLSFPTDQWWRGTWSFGVGLAMVPLACAVVVTAVGPAATWRGSHRGRAPGPGDVPSTVLSTVRGRCWSTVRARAAPVAVAVLAVAGLAALQPAAAVVAVLVLAGWAAGLAMGRRWWRDLAVVGLVGLAALAVPVVVGGVVASSPTLSSLAQHDYATRRSLLGATLQVLGQVTPVSASLGYPIPRQAPQLLLGGLFCAAALVVVSARRTLWLAGVWALFVAAAVAAVHRGEGPLHALTLFFYSSPFRLVAVASLLGAVLLGVAVARAAGRLAARPGRSPWPVAAALVAGACALAVVAAGTLQRGEVRLRVGFGDRVLGPDQAAVMAALAAEPVPAGSRVLNDAVDGSPWLYALTGRMPMFTHYNTGTVPPDVAYLRDHLSDVDTDPRVRSILREHRVCLVYRSATTVSDTRPASPGFTGLSAARSLEPVAARGGAEAYRVSDAVGSCR